MQKAKDSHSNLEKKFSELHFQMSRFTIIKIYYARIKTMMFAIEIDNNWMQQCSETR